MKLSLWLAAWVLFTAALILAWFAEISNPAGALSWIAMVLAGFAVLATVIFIVRELLRRS